MFWVYMLKCADGKLYIGETDNYEKRLYQHQRGLISKCFTFRRRPLVPLGQWAFPTRLEAKEFERRLKGWSRAKKLAFVEGGFAAVAALKTANSPSTTLRFAQE